jgi:hypothetical protein
MPNCTLGRKMEGKHCAGTDTASFCRAAKSRNPANLFEIFVAIVVPPPDLQAFQPRSGAAAYSLQ